MRTTAFAVVWSTALACGCGPGASTGSNWVVVRGTTALESVEILRAGNELEGQRVPVESLQARAGVAGASGREGYSGMTEMPLKGAQPLHPEFGTFCQAW